MPPFFLDHPVVVSTANVQRVAPGLNTGRVDPRVGSGRIEISDMDYFFICVG